VNVYIPFHKRWWRSMDAVGAISSGVGHGLDLAFSMS